MQSARDTLSIVRVRLSLLLCSILLLATAGATAGTSSGAIASARALGVSVVSDAGNASAASVSAPPDAAGDGSFSYGDGALTVASLSTRASAAGGASAAAAATSIASSVSLFNGEITIDSVRVSARASASPTSDGGSLNDSSVSGLTVLGEAVEVGANSRVPLADWGYLVVLEQATQPAEAGKNGKRVFGSGVHIHLTSAHGGLPAATDITIAYAEASASATEAPLGEPEPGATTGGSGGSGSGAGSGDHSSGSGGQSGGGSGGQTDGAGTDAGAPTHHSGGPSQGGTSPTSDAAHDPVPLPPGASPTPPPIVRNPPPGVRPHLTNGGYVFPVYGPDASFSDDFQAARADTGWHHGNDIFAPVGTPVLAVTDGELFLVGVNTLGGNRLWLRDANGNEFYYAHLSAYSPLAFDGSKVKAGDVIGFVGTTGDAVGTPPHLHFEIHPRALLGMGYDGVVDPFPYLSAWRHLDDLAFAAGAKAPQAGAILLQADDISGVSGLDPAALARVLASPQLFGEGLASAPIDANSSSPGFAEGVPQGTS